MDYDVTATILSFRRDGQMDSRSIKQDFLRPYRTQSVLQEVLSIAEEKSRKWQGFVELWLEFKEDPFLYDVSVFFQGEKVKNLEIMSDKALAFDRNGRRELYESVLKEKDGKEGMETYPEERC